MSFHIHIYRFLNLCTRRGFSWDNVMSQIDGHLLFISLYPSSPVKSIEKLETQLISKQHREGTSSFPNGNQLQKKPFSIWVSLLLLHFFCMRTAFNTHCSKSAKLLDGPIKVLISYDVLLSSQGLYFIWMNLLGIVL